MIGSVSRRLRQRDWLPYVLGVAFVALLSVLLAGLAIRGEHERRRQYAGTVTRNLALLVEAQLAGVLAQADLRLQAQAGGGAPLLDGWRAALPTPAPGLSVTGPLRDEQGSWVIRLSRPAASPSQPPLQLSLPVEEFGAIIERVDLGPHGAVAIRSADLALIYRQPMPPGGSSLIGSREVSAELKEAVAATPEAGDFVARTALDGIARINAFQRVDNYPFYVLVGLPEDDFPHGWNPLDTALMAVAMITLVAVATGAGLLLRLQRQQVGDAWRRFEVIVTSSHDAILTQSLDGMVLSWNPAAERILGWRADEVLGRPI